MHSISVSALKPNLHYSKSKRRGGDKKNWYHLFEEQLESTCIQLNDLGVEFCFDDFEINELPKKPKDHWYSKSRKDHNKEQAPHMKNEQVLGDAEVVFDDVSVLFDNVCLKKL